MFNESSCVCVVTLPDGDADEAALLDAVVGVACALSEEAAEPVTAAESPVAAVAGFVFAAELVADGPAFDGVDSRSELALEEADFETVKSPAACAVASVVSLNADGTN